jgi:hypothetical protein
MFLFSKDQSVSQYSEVDGETSPAQFPARRRCVGRWCDQADVARREREISLAAGAIGADPGSRRKIRSGKGSLAAARRPRRAEVVRDDEIASNFLKETVTRNCSAVRAPSSIV